MPILQHLSDLLLIHVTELANRGLPFDVDAAAEATGRAATSIRITLTHHLAGDKIALETRRENSGARHRQYRITIIETGKSTAWPESVASRDLTPADRHDAIFQARLANEENRIAHERHWLEQERKTQHRRSRDRGFFIDKETARALSGGIA